LPFGEKRQTDISPQDLPPWRGKPVPQELQDRLASPDLQNATQSRINQVIEDFFIEQDQLQMAVRAIQTRRSALDQQPISRPPFEIQIVPGTPSPVKLNFQLTKPLDGSEIVMPKGSGL
jgi:hypothetical protein